MKADVRNGRTKKGEKPNDIRDRVKTLKLEAADDVDQNILSRIYMCLYPHSLDQIKKDYMELGILLKQKFAIPEDVVMGGIAVEKTPTTEEAQAC